MQFKFPIDQCYVEDKDRLARYRERMTVWDEWLSEDPEHSIWKQIYQMLWNDAVFRIICEARRLAQKHPSPEVGFNDAISNFIDQSYVATQLMAIRRLTEQSRHNDAISLRRLLQDLKDNVDLFTREIYVCHDGLPFDPEPAKARSLERIPKSKKGKFTGMVSPDGPDAWAASERAHAAFDCLISNKPPLRSRTERLDSRIFDQIASKLGGCDSIGKIASKFIAHAADTGSRRKLKSSVPMDQITRCQKAVCQVASYICGPLLYIGSSNLLPIPQYGHLQDMDKAWVTTEDLPKLKKFWLDHDEKLEAWVSGNWIQTMNLPG